MSLSRYMTLNIPIGLGFRIRAHHLSPSSTSITEETAAHWRGWRQSAPADVIRQLARIP
ncbi:uncharacterized protein MEPE_03053 [Melanopsichium pennsylvanicum]|uniref:Uncharacterized protein n=1 Tax=Melanopsichium pennsylvanicum TaxID=63383 RepID=A0AAJ5C5A8_9BASI|nr:uncharacterized protein MEPE_03053 [Melanopsichium pennsylvanicum]